jgi:hypothetical protein
MAIRTRKPANRVLPEQDIVDRIYADLQETGVPMPLHRAVVKRVSSFLQDVDDRALVELVIRESVRADGANFSIPFTLDPVAFEHTRRRLDIPDGAWRYALWAYDCDRPDLKQSVEYWINAWRDGIDAEDGAIVERAREMLAKLMDYTGDGTLEEIVI